MVIRTPLSQKTRTWLLILSVIFFSSYGMAQFDINEARFIGHVPQLGGGYEAEVLVTNHAGNSKEVYLLGFPNGSSNPQFALVSLFPGERKALGLNDLFSSNDISHFFIAGSRQVTVALRVKASGEERGADTLLPESEDRGRRFTVYPLINPRIAGAWEGLAILNLNPISFGQIPDVEVTLFLKASDGTILKANTYSLGASEKALLVLNQVFPDTQTMDREDYYFDITSTADIAVTFLKGNTESKDINTSFPITPLKLDEPAPGLANTENSEAYTLQSATLHDNVLTLEILPEISCPWDLSLYYGEFTFNPETLNYQIELQPGLRSKSRLCSGDGLPFEKEFDLSPLATQTGSLFRGRSVDITILDQAGEPTISLSWMVPAEP